MLIDAHVHIFPNVNGYGPKGHTHSEGYGRIDAGDGIAQDVLPAINESTSHTLQMLLHEMRQAQVDKAVLILCPCYGDWSEYVLQACRDYPEQFTASAFLTLGVRRHGSIMPKSWKDRFGKTLKSNFPRRAACMESIQVCSWMRQSCDGFGRLWKQAGKQFRLISAGLVTALIRQIRLQPSQSAIRA